MNDLISSGLVDEFGRVENQLLQVLLTEFTLHRTAMGTRLEVGFDERTPTVWQRDGKTAVHRWMLEKSDHHEKVVRYQQEINRFLDGDDTISKVFSFNDPAFPFRYVSGGTLPVVRMGSTEYYALFYRDVFPIGWNISNGSSDTREELLQPMEAIERELHEELMVVAAKHHARYVFASEAGKTLERSEYAVARRLWGERFTSGGYSDFRKWNELTIPMKWEKGPDCVHVSLAGAKAEETSDCYITITTPDFGIEVDRVAKMTVDDDAILLDGEVHGSKLLNRPVGLFEVEKLNAAVDNGHTCILPDRYFYGVPDPKCKMSYYEGSEWLEHAAPALLADVKSWRSAKQIQEFEACKLKFDLCPVTKRMIQRLVKQVKSEARQVGSPPSVTSAGCEVFISYGGDDQRFAKEIFRYVKDRLGLKVFFTGEGTQHSHFRREIDNALESCHTLVSVGSSLANLKREYPMFECQAFHNDMLNRNKSADAQIISMITGFDPRYLPLPQRVFQAIEFDPINMDSALEELAKYLKRKI